MTGTRVRERALPLENRQRLVALVCILALAYALGFPAPGSASGWPLTSAGSVTLGFAERYAAPDGATSTHRGVDIVAGSGSSVVAPMQGTVSFAGRVPGPQGGSVLAASLVTSRGTITVMPLESLSVEAGTRVEAGSALGTLAGDGDPSSPGAHLHVGARSGDMYIDPMTLLTAPSLRPTEAEPSAPPRVVEVPGVSTAPLGAGLGVVVAPKGTVVRGAAVSAGAPAMSAETLSARSAGSAGSGAQVVSAPGASLAPGVSIAGEPADMVAGSASTIEVAARSILDSSRQGGVGPAAGFSAGKLVERAMRMAVEAARLAGLGLAGALLALGALWPMWRKEKRKGLVQVSVRPSGDDVAAVAGR